MAKKPGFTLIELMIATLIFSLVLVVLLAAFLQIGRLFYKGISMSHTQESTRSALQDISDDITLAKDAPIQPAGKDYFCVGLHRYKYVYKYQLGDDYDALANKYGIIREDVAAGCPDPATPGSGSNAQELLDNGMQLNDLTINCSNGVCRIHLHVIFYGADKDVFASPKDSGLTGDAARNAPDAECTGSLQGSQYCATADFTSTVLQDF